MENNTVPTLFEWAGGMPAFEYLFEKFYDKVLADPILEPVFKHMSPEHRIHVAHFVAEVLGGPTAYSDLEGSHFKMIQKHLSRHLTNEHRKRWIELLLQTADEFPCRMILNSVRRLLPTWNGAHGWRLSIQTSIK